MIAFQPPEVGDKPWVDDCFRAAGNRGCEYSFATLFLWSDTFRQQVARMDDYVLERLCGRAGSGYLFPAGRGPLEPVLEALETDAAERGEPCRLLCVTSEQLERLEALRPGQYQCTPDRDGWDYLYEIGRLADLGGKKLHSKRNHIHRFEENCPDWAVEEITVENLAECAEMDLEWNRLYRQERENGAETTQSRMDERHAMSKAFAHYDALGLTGLLLRTGGRVVAFTMGSPIGADTFDIHFEKAYGEIQGAYAMINRAFARWIRDHYPQVCYLNREDDMGLEGLRKAKESYYPDCMVEKYTLVRPMS